MKLFGEIMSFFAELILNTTWDKLENDLDIAYNKYKFFLKLQMPPVIVSTLIVAEDHRFYKHGGVDFIAIGRVFWCLMFGRIQSGGSTIEQQLVRTLTGRYERQLSRKIREILLASLVHKVIPKSDVPGVYLSVAYFGWQMVGIQQACRRLKIELKNISLRQAASIVSRLKYPEPKVSPSKRKRRILVRTEYLMKLSMQNSKFLSQNEIEVKNNATLRDF